MLRWLAGVKGRRIRELTSVVQKRFKFPEGTVELYAEKVNNRGLCAIAQAESLRYKLLGGLAVRRWGPLPSALATLATHPFLHLFRAAGPACMHSKSAASCCNPCTQTVASLQPCNTLLRYLMVP